MALPSVTLRGDDAASTAACRGAANTSSTRSPGRTRRRVLRLLLASPLDRLSAVRVAEQLHMSSATLRRHLAADATSYQALLDAVRVHRCKRLLASRPLPGKALAYELGFNQPNSFYRAFHKWTGMTFTEYRARLRDVSAPQA